MKGLKSLRVQFGDTNVSSVFFCQVVPVPAPGPYQVEFYLRTEGLTTDQMPYAAVLGYLDTSGTFARSISFPATTAWSKISIPFTANNGCTAILLALQRNKSLKFDNRIKGTLWLDGFTLRSATARPHGNLFAP
jgi:hypothetical protein